MGWKTECADGHGMTYRIAAKEATDAQRFYFYGIFCIKIVSHDIPPATNIYQNTAPPSSSSFPQVCQQDMEGCELMRTGLFGLMK
jgi:hypothetical protein